MGDLWEIKWCFVIDKVDNLIWRISIDSEEPRLMAKESH